MYGEFFKEQNDQNENIELDQPFSPLHTGRSTLIRKHSITVIRIRATGIRSMPVCERMTQSIFGSSVEERLVVEIELFVVRILAIAWLIRVPIFTTVPASRFLFGVV